MTTSVVIATYGSAAYIDACLDALPAAAAGLPLQVIVVDSCSRDDTRERLLRRPEVHAVLLDRNVGFARSSNAGMRLARHDVILLLNPDTLPQPGSIRALNEFLVAHPRCAAVGARLTDGAGLLQPSAGGLPTLLGTLAHAAGLNLLLPRDEGRRRQWFARLGHVMPRSASRLMDHSTPHRCEVVWAAAVALRRRALEQVGLLDESGFMYGEESDLCARLARRGWEVWFDPSAEVLHYGGGASPFAPRLAASFYSARLRFFRRFGRPRQSMAAPFAVYGGLLLRPLVRGVHERSPRAAADAAVFSAVTGLRLLGERW